MLLLLFMLLLLLLFVLYILLVVVLLLLVVLILLLVLLKWCCYRLLVKDLEKDLEKGDFVFGELLLGYIFWHKIYYFSSYN